MIMASVSDSLTHQRPRRKVTSVTTTSTRLVIALAITIRRIDADRLSLRLGEVLG